MMYEIRNYHFKLELFAQYKDWARTKAVPHLGKELDLVGFWVSNADAPEVDGEPQDHLAG